MIDLYINIFSTLTNWTRAFIREDQIGIAKWFYILFEPNWITEL